MDDIKGDVFPDGFRYANVQVDGDGSTQPIKDVVKTPRTSLFIVEQAVFSVRNDSGGALDGAWEFIFFDADTPYSDRDERFAHTVYVRDVADGDQVRIAGPEFGCARGAMIQPNTRLRLAFGTGSPDFDVELSMAFSQYYLGRTIE